jgi:hypothetical protein
MMQFKSVAGALWSMVATSFCVVAAAAIGDRSKQLAAAEILACINTCTGFQPYHQCSKSKAIIST